MKYEDIYRKEYTSWDALTEGLDSVMRPGKPQKQCVTFAEKIEAKLMQVRKAWEKGDPEANENVNQEMHHESRVRRTSYL